MIKLASLFAKLNSADIKVINGVIFEIKILNVKVCLTRDKIGLAAILFFSFSAQQLIENNLFN